MRLVPMIKTYLVENKAIMLLPTQLILLWLISTGGYFIVPEFWALMFYGNIACIAIFMVHLTILVLIYTVFCIIFPSYYRITDNGVRTKDGRCYWHSGIKMNAELYDLKDFHFFWVNQNLLLNIFNPWASLTEIRIYKKEKSKFQRNWFSIDVVEPKYRYRLEEKTVKYPTIICTNSELFDTDIDNDIVVSLLYGAMDEMIENLQTVGHANPDIFKEILQKSAISINPDMKRRLENARKK